uniref:Putative secreted protein n=1 Tax=Anopheles marajoara TaxID=58244 RepID=A0A2M4CAX5_9DIPT
MAQRRAAAMVMVLKPSSWLRYCLLVLAQDVVGSRQPPTRQMTAAEVEASLRSPEPGASEASFYSQPVAPVLSEAMHAIDRWNPC